MSAAVAKAEIRALATLSEVEREAAARVLLEALAHVPSAWHAMDAARAETAQFFGNPERLGFAAIEQGTLRGWIGAIRHTPFSWELHPLVVAPGEQRKGYGSLLVAALEKAARDEGLCTLWVGTDDDFGGTNLYGRSLYPDVLERLKELAPIGGHPFTFYRARGFSVVGVLPDVDGPGRHDLLLAKRIDEKARS